jgi:hypothetical protein
MGFGNFYLAAGLSLLCLAAAWRGGALRVAASLPLLALAATAHLLPVCWALGMLGYALLARRVCATGRPWLLAGCCAALAALRLALSILCPTRWDASQLLSVTTADQAWVYGRKYMLISFGLLYLFGLLLPARASDADPESRIMLSGAGLTAFGVAVLPNAVLFPQYRHSLDFIAYRMSLLLGVTYCAVLAGGVISKRARLAFAALAALFFSFLYADSRALNRFEDRVQAAVSQAPPASRLINGVKERSARIDPLTHVIDRVCVGRCYSYANYEPSTWQFLVRAEGPNPVVMHRYADAFAVAEQVYTVRPEDGRLWQLRARRGAPGQVELVPLAPGEAARRSEVSVLPRLW